MWMLKPGGKQILPLQLLLRNSNGCEISWVRQEQQKNKHGQQQQQHRQQQQQYQQQTLRVMVDEIQCQNNSLIFI
jgi:hypothetical protein